MKALAAAEQLIKAEPSEPIGQPLASAVHLSMGNVEAARGALLKARAIRRGDVSANDSLAKLALADGNWNEARQYYQEILDIHPRSTKTYLELAALNAKAGRPQEAKPCWRKECRLIPVPLR